MCFYRLEIVQIIYWVNKASLKEYDEIGKYTVNQAMIESYIFIE